MKDSFSAAVLETVEAESYVDFEAAASPEAQAALGTRWMRSGGGVATAMPNDPTGFWSKAVGHGFTQPITEGLLTEIFDFYRETGMRSVTLAFAPQVIPPNWADICAKLNIADSGSTWVKQAGRVESIVGKVAAKGGASAYLDHGLRVEEIGPEQAREWSSVMWEAFGFPAEHQVEMGVGVVGKPDWKAFAVFEDNQIVACGCLHIVSKYGHLFGAATLPLARNRGAQSALIAARALAADAAGAEWLLAETFAEEPGDHNPSLHNMARAGMPVWYERKNWTWRDTAE